MWPFLGHPLSSLAGLVWFCVACDLHSRLRQPSRPSGLRKRSVATKHKNCCPPIRDLGVRCISRFGTSPTLMLPLCDGQGPHTVPRSSHGCCTQAALVSPGCAAAKHGAAVPSPSVDWEFGLSSWFDESMIVFYVLEPCTKTFRRSRAWDPSCSACIGPWTMMSRPT